MTTFHGFIPWVKSTITQADLETIFKELDWGTVSRIKLVQPKYGSQDHYIVFVDFTSWNSKYNHIKQNLETDPDYFETIYYNYEDELHTREFFKLFKNKKTQMKQKQNTPLLSFKPRFELPEEYNPKPFKPRFELPGTNFTPIQTAMVPLSPAYTFTPSSPAYTPSSPSYMPVQQFLVNTEEHRIL